MSHTNNLSVAAKSPDKIMLLGDVHGDYRHVVSACKNYPNHTVFQVGDLGIIPQVGGMTAQTPFPDNFCFIRGNHDCPDEVQYHKAYLGDYGWFLYKGEPLMYIGGAYSIDNLRRVAGHDWFPREELTREQALECLEMYEKVKPAIVVTHEAPNFLHSNLLEWAGKRGAQVFNNNTALLFNTMFARHKPRHWYHGHWHLSYRHQISGCEFVGIGINDIVDIS